MKFYFVLFFGAFYILFENHNCALSPNARKVGLPPSAVPSFRVLNTSQLELAGTGRLSFSAPLWVFSKDSLTTEIKLGNASRSSPSDFKSQIGEDFYAIEHFFNKSGKGGIILESGALDGVTFSTSWAFEKTLGWKAIHIEANPFTYSELVRNRPDALNINVALCEEPRTLHVVFGEKKSAVGGIWEFMSPEFKKYWWGEIKDVKSLPSVICIPLAPLLQLFDVSHVNFWVLDVEGAELEVLHATDFERVTFDVIAMETLGQDNEKDLAAISFLESKGYIHFSSVGHNTWLVSKEMASRAIA